MAHLVLALHLATVMDARELLVHRPEAFRTNYRDLFALVKETFPDNVNYSLEETLFGQSLKMFKKESPEWKSERDTGRKYKVPAYPFYGLNEIDRGDAVTVNMLLNISEKERTFEGRLAEIQKRARKLLKSYTIPTQWTTVRTLSDVYAIAYLATQRNTKPQDF